jgi:hypothetical protein
MVLLGMMGKILPLLETQIPEAVVAVATNHQRRVMVAVAG